MQAAALAYSAAELASTQQALTEQRTRAAALDRRATEAKEEAVGAEQRAAAAAATAAEAGARAAAAQASADALAAQVDGARTQCTHLEQQLAASQSSIDACEAALQRERDALAESRLLLETAQSEHAQLTGRAEQAEAKTEELQAELDEAHAVASTARESRALSAKHTAGLTKDLKREVTRLKKKLAQAESTNIVLKEKLSAASALAASSSSPGARASALGSPRRSSVAILDSEATPLGASLEAAGTMPSAGTPGRSEDAKTVALLGTRLSSVLAENGALKERVTWLQHSVQDLTEELRAAQALSSTLAGGKLPGTKAAQDSDSPARTSKLSAFARQIGISGKPSPRAAHPAAEAMQAAQEAAKAAGVNADGIEVVVAATRLPAHAATVALAGVAWRAMAEASNVRSQMVALMAAQAEASEE